jgi:uncharacterized membrane protein
MKDISSRVVTSAVGLLVIVGVVASLARYLLPHDLHLTVARPLYGIYADEQLPVMAAHPHLELLHRLGGAIYMILGVMQFMPRIRTNYVSLHRWSGRIFLGLSAAAAASGLVIVVAFPFEPGERLPSFLFSALMLFCAAKAYIAIRRRQVAAHREWITRSFAVGLGIATIRLLAAPVLLVTHLTTHDVLVPAFWGGWGLTFIAAEVLIRARRAKPPTTLAA